MDFSNRSTTIAKAEHVTINQSTPAYQKRPALISKVIKILSGLPPTGENGSVGMLSSYDIDAKLDHTHVFRYRALVEEYGEYGQNVIKALNTVDQEKMGAEQKILKLINSFYKESIGELKKHHAAENKGTQLIESIRLHSDQIIESVINKLVTVVNNSSNGSELAEEDLILGANYVVAHAFIECKVLERPSA